MQRNNSQPSNSDKRTVNHFMWHLSRCMLSVTFVLLGMVFLAWVERESFGVRSVVIIFGMITILIGYFWLSSRVMCLVPEAVLRILIWFRMTIVAVAISVLWLISDCAKPDMGLHATYGDLLHFMRCSVIGHDLGAQ
jgi:hypothetical protein